MKEQWILYDISDRMTARNGVDEYFIVYSLIQKQKKKHQLILLLDIEIMTGGEILFSMTVMEYTNLKYSDLTVNHQANTVK